MPYSNMPIVARPYPLPLFLKRYAMAAFAGLFLAACASKPKPILSTDAYTVNSVTVSSTASDKKFKSALEDALSGAFSGKGSGLESILNVTVTNVRIGGNFATVFYRASNAATMNVVVRSSKTGLKLRDFKFSVTSNATDAEQARTQMAEKARWELKKIFRTRVKPQVIAEERKEPLVKAKKKTKPISVEPIADLDSKVDDEPVVTTIEVPEKPKLLPIAEASPESATEIIKAAEPSTDVKEIESPSVVTAPEIKPEAIKPETNEPSAVTPKVEAPKPETVKVEPAPVKEDDVLCVVTLENDCSS